MSKYVDIDPIIDAIYKKWSGDPAYFANDTPTGIEAGRDASLIELLRGNPSIDIVRCKDCNHWNKKTHICDSSGLYRTESFYCRNGEGERRKAHE